MVNPLWDDTNGIVDESGPKVLEVSSRGAEAHSSALYPAYGWLMVFCGIFKFSRLLQASHSDLVPRLFRKSALQDEVVFGGVASWMISTFPVSKKRRKRRNIGLKVQNSDTVRIPDIRAKGTALSYFADLVTILWAAWTRSRSTPVKAKMQDR